MKAVLMSIHPKWCELIFSGEKTIEVRKTAPKLETPFKVYAYCTNSRFDITDIDDLISESVRVVSEERGKVIGEFVCRAVEKYDIDLGGDYYRISDKDSIHTCLGQNLLFKYGNGRDLYGWHISDLKIYDKPRELGEFKTPDKPYHKIIERDGSLMFMDGYENGKPLKRAPQSWQYVEEIRDESVLSVL